MKTWSLYFDSNRNFLLYGKLCLYTVTKGPFWKLLHPDSYVISVLDSKTCIDFFR